MTGSCKDVQPHFKLLGIGAGPANLSLASLLYGKQGIKNIFLDGKSSFSWHDDQMIEGATLQVSLFKDLSTLADPTNIFTFLAYLHEKGRIYHFLNAQFDEVPRREFRNYLAWAAEKNENVIFGEKVLNIDFDKVFKIVTDKRELTAENISIGVGTQPWVPEFATAYIGKTQFHVSQYMQRSSLMAGKRVIIIGGGQSGAEVFLDLLSKPDSDRPTSIHWISRRRNFFPIDDSTFTNDFYMPYYSDYFNKLPLHLRQSTNRENILTSDGISESTLRQIYQKLYSLNFITPGKTRIVMQTSRSVSNVKPTGRNSWQLEYCHLDSLGTEIQEADVVVWATGYSPTEKRFLGTLVERIHREKEEFVVDKDFAVKWDGPKGNNIFVQNAVRGQRGLPDLNLSLNAWRAQRIVGRLCGEYPSLQHPSFIDWAPPAENNPQEDPNIDEKEYKRISHGFLS
ncbi:L-lysine 6-monooxygenase [Lonsdalea britannica]|uniref:L-lysine 6-monooxygenase n=1 Tax=Lonsdalea britannica TaxID=1082704 RepID=A0AAD0SCQ4_9GAMM|nr:SidA/IucD/PvdA family monooxygenase [Lonsdalea britannica]AXW85665.1 L-lysine 6-monooxygenase [Lonsdalea britannica]OSM96500.1 L-lysine 6-monooxygenase [Lonsdalea britannica]